MTEEWRLSIDFTGHPDTGQRFGHGGQVREALHSRFGNDIVISAEEGRTFLYAEHADIAAEAELAARQVLAQQGLSADFRLDRWDPSGQVWRDARSNEPEQDTAPLQADAGGPGRGLRSWDMVDAISTVISGALDGTTFS